ncbi:MAG: hypothetical protein UW80_C0009G0003 [Microgenomates group bacterium GW2011_GWC1_44_9]|nr:MAG: hypothetical protein UW80_C0009G0003 [Microgenomates group bacterium GW2011_GWC1_44_9]
MSSINDESHSVEKNDTSSLEKNLQTLKTLFNEASPVVENPEEIFENLKEGPKNDDFTTSGWTKTRALDILDQNTGIAICYRKNQKGEIQLWVGQPTDKDIAGKPYKINFNYYIVLDILITQAGIHRHLDPIADIESAFYNHFKELNEQTLQWLRDWAKRNPEGVIEIAPMIEEMTSDF